MRGIDKELQNAVALHRAGELAAAALGYSAVLELVPTQTDAQHMLGMVRHQQGDDAEALRLLGLALGTSPGRSGAILANRASVLLALERYAEAEADAREAATREPLLFGAWFNLGLALLGLKRGEAAVPALARASSLRTHDARALLQWLSAAAISGLSVEMAKRLQLPLPPLSSERRLALAVTETLERHESASLSAQLLAQLHAELPGDADVWYRYAQALKYAYRGDEALAQLNALLEISPEHRNALLLLANMLLERGEIESALRQYRRLIQSAPADADVGSAYLLALQHDPGTNAAALAEAHRAWAARHAPQVAPRWRASAALADPERDLRIGWISPRFHQGVVTTFFAAPLEKLDHTHLRHVLYSCNEIDDSATLRFRRAADLWRDVQGLDDEALCAQIRADKIDVLVELSGHAPRNRLRMLAARAAPVQVSWMDYFHSSGLDAIDFLVSDSILTPAELFCHYSERVLHLASGRLCYEPPPEAPAIVAHGSERIRFASFNRPSKINDSVLSAWTRILSAVPGSLLRLKAGAFDHADTCTSFLARAARHNISPGQLELRGFGSYADVMTCYTDTDIALDPFPFSGCSTSCDALWMGVPVVTLIGQTMVSRQSASLLSSLDLDDLIATDVDGYVACAVDLARNDERRLSLRATLRPLMRERLCNADRHAAELGAALRQAWRSWCLARET